MGVTVQRRTRSRPTRSVVRDRERAGGAVPINTAALWTMHGPGTDAAGLETILRHVHDAVFATDLSGTITFWAPSAERLFEYTPAQAVGRRFRDLLPSRIAEPGSASDIEGTVAASQTWRGEGSVVLPSGAELWLESTISPVIVDGQPVGSVSLSRDMTATHAIYPYAGLSMIVYWGYYTSICELDLSMFPFDKQKCSVSPLLNL